MAVPTTGFLGLFKPLLNQFSKWGQYYDNNWDKIDANASAANENISSNTNRITVVESTLSGFTADVAQVAGDRVFADASAVAADADRIAAEQAAAAADADRIAAEAAWAAALAANPDLNPQIRMNPSTVAADISIPTGYNAYSSGPLEIGESVTVTVQDNANWNII